MAELKKGKRHIELPLDVPLFYVMKCYYSLF